MNLWLHFSSSYSNLIFQIWEFLYGSYHFIHSHSFFFLSYTIYHVFLSLSKNFFMLLLEQKCSSSTFIDFVAVAFDHCCCCCCCCCLITDLSFFVFLMILILDAWEIVWLLFGVVLYWTKLEIKTKNLRLTGIDLIDIKFLQCNMVVYRWHYAMIFPQGTQFITHERYVYERYRKMS